MAMGYYSLMRVLIVYAVFPGSFNLTTR